MLCHSQNKDTKVDRIEYILIYILITCNYILIYFVMFCYVLLQSLVFKGFQTVFLYVLLLIWCAQRAHELHFKILFYIINLLINFKCTVICTAKIKSACVWSWILVLFWIIIPNKAQATRLNFRKELKPSR